MAAKPQWRISCCCAAATTADGRFRGNARRVISLSEAKGLQITPRTLPADCGGEIDYNYAQGLLEQSEPSEG